MKKNVIGIDVSKALGQLAKTDKIDAKILALFGAYGMVNAHAPRDIDDYLRSPHYPPSSAR